MVRNPASDTLPIPSVSDCQTAGIPMPDLLVRMEEALGADPVRAFLADWAGREYAVRGTETPHGQAHREVSEWLRKQIGWGNLLIPMGPAGRSVRLRHAIWVQLRAGRSLARIAGSIGCHTRTVSRHKQSLARRGLLPETISTTKDPRS